MNDAPISSEDMIITGKSDDRTVISSALKEIGMWDNYFSQNRVRGRDDMLFLYQDQWTLTERSELQRLSKPPMTVNKMYDIFRKIVGEQRRNTPNLMIRSLTGKASQKSIDLRSDIVRSIAYDSKNDIVYQTAFSSALSRGFGAFLIYTDYESPNSFNQVIKYKAINYPERCFWDSRANDPTKSDANHAGMIHMFTHEEFRAMYPDKEIPTSFSTTSLMGLDWLTRQNIVLCDYYVKEFFTKTIVQLQNGKVMDEKEYKKLKKEYEKMVSIYPQAVTEFPMPEVHMTRRAMDNKVWLYKLSCEDVIEKKEWPSRHIPLIFVDGDSYYIDGRQYTRSFIHDAKDAQRFLNYLASDIAAQFKNSRREQWMATIKNIEGQEKIWRTPELQQGTLIYKPDLSVPGTVLKPERLPPSELPQTLLMHYQRATDDIKQILGVYDANLGAQSNDISGRAVRNRALQGAMSPTVFFDNLNRAVEQGGRVTLSLLPTIYGDERNVTVQNIDGKTRSIVLNQEMPNGQINNEISGDDYDIEAKAGPNFAVQQEAAIEMLMGLVQSNPQIFPLVADIIAKNVDVQFQQQLVERLSTLVPPNILAKEKGLPPPPPPPPDPMMQMQQAAMQQEIMLKDEELKLKQEEIEMKRMNLRFKGIELLQNAETAEARNEAEIEKAHMSMATEIAKLMANLEKTKVTE